VRPWAIGRFCLATVLSCLAVIAFFLAWIRLANADRPGVVALLVSLGTLIAVVLSFVGIFVVLVVMPNPNRSSVRGSGLGRFCLATLLGCGMGFVLFFFWFGVAYALGGEWGVATDLVTGSVLIAMVLGVVRIFSALVFRPSAQRAGADVAAGGWAPDPSGRFELRYHYGANWTEHVLTNGRASEDPPA
jgi:hypothetical protein